MEKRMEKSDLLTRLGWLCLVAVIWSTLAQLVGMVNGYHTNRFGGYIPIPLPTLSRCTIMGNSFNCLPIIHYMGDTHRKWSQVT